MPAVAQDGVSLKIEEKLNVTLKKDGGIEGMEVQGTMMLEIRGGEEDAFIRVGVATGANEGFQFKIHPNIDKQLHACLLYTSPSPRDKRQSRMPSSA